jgi:decaprenylphospho-beta-D-erythro-pentofuranosid-2-ulose 2-reductase
MAGVLILGATSAIAAAAARLYAGRGDRLHLVGRSAGKLEALRAQLAGAELSWACADFNDTAAAPAIIEEAIRALGTIDVVLVAHGYLGDQLGSERTFAEAELILRTNFLGVVALLIPLANHLEAAGHGRLGVITSVAGDRGRPRNFTYGAAKGGLGLYLQGLRSRLYPAGVTVTTLKLGPVDTPMTVDHRKNVLFARPDGVARTIVAAIDRGEGEAYVPRYWRAIMSVVRNAPEALFQRLRALSGR